MIRRERIFILVVVACSMLGGDRIAVGGSPIRRRPVAFVPTSVAPAAVVPDRNANAPTPMLGTFYSTPFMMVRGDRPTGGGYSPLGMYGPNTLSIYGPLSAYRSVSAPVRVYSRGYDGAVYEAEGTSFSTPFRPEASPVIYPTPNTYYYRPRGTSLPPTFPSPINWIDQN